MSFVNILVVTGILWSIILVLERKAGRELPESSRRRGINRGGKTE